MLCSTLFGFWWTSRKGHPLSTIRLFRKWITNVETTWRSPNFPGCPRGTGTMTQNSYSNLKRMTVRLETVSIHWSVTSNNCLQSYSTKYKVKPGRRIWGAQIPPTYRRLKGCIPHLNSGPLSTHACNLHTFMCYMVLANQVLLSDAHLHNSGLHAFMSYVVLASQVHLYDA